MYWDCGHETMPKARKDHVCEQCQKPITKGTVHKRWDGKFEGDFFTIRTHFECDEAADHYLDFFEFPADEGITLHNLTDREDLQFLRRYHPVVAERLGLIDPELL